MWEKLQEIIGAVEVKELESEKLKEAFLNAEDYRKADEAIGTSRLAATGSICQEYQAVHALCQAAIHYASNLHLSLNSALHSGRRALEGFRCLGNQFNEALSLRVLSIVHEKTGEIPQALNELRRALEIFKNLADLYDQESNLAAKSRCDFQIAECRQALHRIENGIPPKSKPVPPSVKWPSLRLIYRVYDFGHASLVGKFVLDDEPITDVEISQVVIENKPHQLFSTQMGTPQITISPDQKLFWLKVAGQSMNRASPTPIEENDYILVDHERLPEQGDIVFAQFKNPPTPDERAGIIKRLKGTSLHSESTQSLPEIPLFWVSIKGVVIAVAKRIHS